MKSIIFLLFFTNWIWSSCRATESLFVRGIDSWSSWAAFGAISSSCFANSGKNSSFAVPSKIARSMLPTHFTLQKLEIKSLSIYQTPLKIIGVEKLSVAEEALEYEFSNLKESLLIAESSIWNPCLVSDVVSSLEVFTLFARYFDPVRVHLQAKIFKPG